MFPPNLSAPDTPHFRVEFLPAMPPSPCAVTLTEITGTAIQLCNYISVLIYVYGPSVVIVMFCDSMNSPSALNIHVYLELLRLAVMLRSSTNTCTNVPCLTTLLDPSNHWRDCTGTGVEHVMPEVSPTWKSLFPVTLSPVAVKLYTACTYSNSIPALSFTFTTILSVLEVVLLS